MLFWPIFGDFWCPVVTVVTFSSTLSNFERNQKKKNPKKNPQKSKKLKKSKNPKKSKKSKKIPKKSKKKSKKSKKNPKSPYKNPKNQKIVKNGQKIRKSQKISKNLKNSLFHFFLFVFVPDEKCYPLSFPILGGRDLTREWRSRTEIRRNWSVSLLNQLFGIRRPLVCRGSPSLGQGFPWSPRD